MGTSRQRRSDYAIGVKLARNWLDRQQGTPVLRSTLKVREEDKRLNQPLTSTMRAGARYGLTRVAGRPHDPWDTRGSWAQDILLRHYPEVPGSGPNGGFSFRHKKGVGVTGTGRNVGSFAHRSGNWKKGKGGRFVGSGG